MHTVLIDQIWIPSKADPTFIPMERSNDHMTQGCGRNRSRSILGDQGVASRPLGRWNIWIFSGEGLHQERENPRAISLTELDRAFLLLM